MLNQNDSAIKKVKSNYKQA